jgi:ribose transport system substrate-binding protein
MDDVAAFIGTDNYQAGYMAGQAMMTDFPDGGPVAVLDYPANTAAVDRATGFLDAIEGSNLEVVQTLDGKGLTEDSTSQMDDILQAHPDLVAVFGINDDSGLGAYAAITAAGMDVKIYAVNGSPAAKEKIAEGGIFAVSVAQSTINMGKQSAIVAYQILDGESYDHDNLIAPITINKDNVEEYGTTGWQ